MGGRVEITPMDETPWLLVLPRQRLWDLMAICLAEAGA